MKIIAVVLGMMLLSGVAIAEVKQEASKFKMSYTVIYNAITLGEASNIETRIKKENKDACSVDVEVKSNTSTVYFSN